MPEPANELTGNRQPVVYVVDRNHESNDAVDLQKLLAPIWRWRWVELIILLLTVLIAGWYYTRGTESSWKIVLNRGSYEPSMVISQMEQVVIPGAVQQVANGWRPNVHIAPATDSNATGENGGQPARPELITLGFDTSNGSAEAHALLASGLRERISAVSSRLATVTSAQKAADKHQLDRSLAAREAELTIISEPAYITALRGRVERSITLTKADITKETALVEQLTRREVSLSQRALDLQATLDTLLASFDSEGRAAAGVQQLLADRIASLRLELEQRIPAERPDLQRRLATSRGELARLNAVLLQQELEAINFATDLAMQQEAVKANIGDIKSNVSLFEARTGANLLHQPLTIVEEFQRVHAVERHLLVTISILVFGGLASIAAAYFLEALRLARLGTLK